MSEWIKHDGKMMPIGPATKVTVRYRDGKTDTAHAGRYTGWEHTYESGDIMEYRIETPERGVSYEDKTKHALFPEKAMPSEVSALSVQEGGDHYKTMKIQPVEYIHANNIPFIEGCVIKYCSRWRDKGGLEDIRKARHFLDLLIEMEEKK